MYPCLLSGGSVLAKAAEDAGFAFLRSSWHFFLLSSPFPDEYKSKVVCEEERMRLSCKRGMQIAIYSAMFGRTQQGTLECPVHHRRAPSVGKAPC